MKVIGPYKYTTGKPGHIRPMSTVWLKTNPVNRGFDVRGSVCLSCLSSFQAVRMFVVNRRGFQ